MNRTIRRREFLAGVGAGLLLPGCGRTDFDPGELRSLESELPYPTWTAPGQNALDAWEHLAVELSDTASPVVIGDMRELRNLIEMRAWDTERSDADVLQLAATLDFPDGFREWKKREYEQMMEQWSEDPNLAQFVDEYRDSRSLPIGDWPPKGAFAESPGLAVARDVMTNRPFDEVVIVAVPTTDWTEIPAYLRFGGWNENPAPEWHVAALRHWRDEYGARLIGISGDVLNIRVSSKPETREAAIELAFEQYDYCLDIVTQGVGDIAVLAAYLMHDDWWYFWWD